MQIALRAAMTWLTAQPDTVFIGQGVGPCGGTKMSSTLDGVPLDRRIEFPVAEELQLSVALGLSLEGYVPVCCFPRWNFLLRATDSLVNHLDKIPLYSAYRPRVIIRVAVGSKTPLDPGPQHDGDFTDAFRLMLRTVRVERVRHATWSLAPYQRAYNRDGSTLIVEG